MLKEKKNHQKVDHFKNDCNCSWGDTSQKYTHFEGKKVMYKAFLLKNDFKCVLTHVFPLFIAFKFLLV